MQFDIIIPTRATNTDVLGATLTSIVTQSCLPAHVFLVCDRQFSPDVFTEFIHWAEEFFHDVPQVQLRILTHLTDDLQVEQQNGSYLRNYGLSHAQSPYSFLLDDDNMFFPDFCEKMIEEYMQAREMYRDAPDGHTHVLYSPAIGRRQTARLQSYGIRDFHYFLSWPEPMQGGWKQKVFARVWGLFRRDIVEDKQFFYPRMIGGNSLFGETDVMRAVRFDEVIAFVMEDLDFTARWQQMQGPIVVSKTNIISHMERDKTPAERSFLADARTAYQKGRNRFLFVQKTANLWEKVQFYGLGAWIQTCWMGLKIIGGDYTNMQQRFSVLVGYIRGTLDGIGR